MKYTSSHFCRTLQAHLTVRFNLIDLKKTEQAPSNMSQLSAKKIVLNLENLNFCIILIEKQSFEVANFAIQCKVRAL